VPAVIASVAGDTVLPSGEGYPSEEARSGRDSFAGDDFFACDTDSQGGEGDHEDEDEDGEVEGMPKNLICPITHQTFR
jgi:hypothetical protein